MKKFVVLTLLLAMAAVATAGLEYAGPEEIGFGESATVALTGTDIFGILVSVDAAAAPGTTLDFSAVAFPTQFDLPGKSQGVTPTYGEVTISNIFGAPKTGDMVTGIVINAGQEEGWVYIKALTGTSQGPGGAQPITGELASVHIIPEPMTFALLGLGGLILRRRK